MELWFLIYIYFLFMVFLSFLYKHIMIFLMIMELIMLINLCLLNFFLEMMNLNFYMILYYLVVVVCESVLGLGLMILIVRMEGVDYMNFMNLKMW